jgi:DNA-binding transcriptional LysR family regulator
MEMVTTVQSRDLQIDWLRAFLAVIDTGSVTAAGRQVSRSQSAVSMQIKKLEESVGRPLLIRGAGHISLTSTGYDLLGYARKMIEVHSSALVALHGGNVTGRVSIGASDDYAPTYLAPVLCIFSSRFSEVEVTVVCEQSTSLLAKVERGEIDLALVTRDMPGRGEFLFGEDLIWVGSDQHEVWKKDPLPIAVHDLGSRLRTEVFSAISAQQREYRVVYNSSNLVGQLALADCGMAVAVITRCSLPPNLKVLDIRNGLPDLPELEIVLVRSKESKRSAAVDAMYDQVVRSLKYNV